MRRAISSAIWLSLAVPLVCASGPALARDILNSEKKIYSQFDEELIIRDFFQDRRKGFYLDVGCAWARKDSTTYFLEKHLGWSGIGVDANPNYAESWQKYRKRGKFFTFLVTDHAAESEKFYAAGAVGSTQKERQIWNQTVRGEEIEVPAITLNQLLEQNGVTKIDFLSMDIEGSEPEALAGFDIKRYRPELVCVEATEKNRDKILAYFAANGYERIEKYLSHDKVNWYFKPKAPADP